MFHISVSVCTMVICYCYMHLRKAVREKQDVQSCSQVSLKMKSEAGRPAGPSEPHSSITPEEALLSQAVVVLSCASYRNQGLHIFLRPALLASAVHTASSNKKRKTETAASMLCCLLQCAIGYFSLSTFPHLIL